MVFKEILNKAAYSNIIIGLGPVSLSYMTAVFLRIETDMFFLLIPFLITFFVYSINRFTDIREDMINNPERTEFIKNKGNYFLFGAVISLIGAFLLSLFHSVLTFMVIAIPAILVTIYSFKMLPSINKKRLKDLFLLKNLTVSFGWSLIPVYVAAYANVFNIGLIVLFCFIFLRILIGVIMFDIRDVIGDKIEGIITIPIKYGIKNSKYIILFLHVLSVLILISGYFIANFSPLLVLAIIIIISILTAFYYINIEKDTDKKFLCNVIVDGEYVILGVLALILSVILS
ncbi:MAG: hypothetical protein DRP84_12340 [Spirochaetes bacterium]|nr:MAG: hypothetical protein DRP84_12340 [Spirochaetota bacterium]